MRVDFVLREPGNHHVIDSRNMKLIPRKDDWVQVGDIVYVVHLVTWIPDKNLVEIMIRI